MSERVTKTKEYGHPSSSSPSSSFNRDREWVNCRIHVIHPSTVFALFVCRCRSTSSRLSLFLSIALIFRFDLIYSCNGSSSCLLANAIHITHCFSVSWFITCKRSVNRFYYRMYVSLFTGFGDDIDWIPWEEAISRAQERQAPIFLLIHKPSCPSCQGLSASLLSYILSSTTSFQHSKPHSNSHMLVMNFFNWRPNLWWLIRIKITNRDCNNLIYDPMVYMHRESYFLVCIYLISITFIFYCR